MYEEWAARCRALGHPARLQILDLLRRGEVCVCHIVVVMGKRQAYISQQLMVLREAGLVATRKEGLRVFYRLADGHVEPLLGAMLGPVPAEAPEPLEGCPCPRCAHLRKAAR